MSTEKVKLVAAISRRLFAAICVLLVALVVLGLAGGSLWPSAFGSEGQAPPPMVLVVIGLGALGGFVGLQRRLKHLAGQDLQLLASSWLYALLSPLVGGVLALVLYALFMSGLLAGELFPRLCPDTSALKQDTYKHLLGCAPQDVAAYAKLFFWSFVAGFSERFVIDIIGRFEHQGNRPEEEPIEGPQSTKES